jgi:hypothetical protein
MAGSLRTGRDEQQLVGTLGPCGMYNVEDHAEWRGIELFGSFGREFKVQGGIFEI